MIFGDGAVKHNQWAALAAVKYASKSIRKGGSIVLTTGIAGQRLPKGWVVAASVCGTIEALTRACPGTGADSRECSISGSRSDEPLAEHECSRTGAAF